MKTIISKVMIILLMLNLIAPFSAYASQEIIIYNCDKIVELDYEMGEFYGKKYINKKDLENINLYITSKSLITCDSDTEMKLYPGSSIVDVNGTTITYPNAIVETEDGDYICIELLAMFFSEIYDVTETTIKLWISDNGYDFARGIISVSSGVTVPSGGIQIEVFAAEAPRTTSSSGLKYEVVYENEQIGPVGYSKNEKPMYEEDSKAYNAFLDYDRKCSDVVVIAEGEKSVEYSLTIDNDDFENCVIGYYTEINGEAYYGKLNYGGNDKLYSFNLSATKPSISGKVTLPQTAENDVEFRIIAHGKYDYIFDGVILEGEKTAEYTVAVDKNNTYSVELIFLDGEYSRELSDEKVSVGTASIGEINFDAEIADEYVVNVSLPDDYNSDMNMIDARVYLQMAKSPYYVLDIEAVSLNEYSRSKSITLHDDMQSNDVICYYVLYNEYDGLFEFGHYTENGTSFDIRNADSVSLDDGSIDMTLLKAKEINASFNLPDSDVAEDDIKIDAYPITVKYPIESNNMAIVTNPNKPDEEGEEVTYLPVIGYPVESGDEIVAVTPIDKDSITLMSASGVASSGGSPSGGLVIGGGGNAMAPVAVSRPTIIAEGQTSGNRTISIPDEDDYGFLIEFNVIDKSDRYYSKIYYNSDKTTTVRGKASLISNKTDSINVELVKQYYISGVIDAVGFEDSHNRITAASQKSDTIIEDIYDCDFSVYTEIYGSGNYGLYVPDEFEKYILRLNSFATGREIYYRPDECTDYLNESKVLNINNDTDNIDFVYSGYNPPTPLVIKVTRGIANSEKWSVSLRNIGDFDTEDIDIYISFYNENGAMTNLVKEDAGVVEARTTLEVPVSVPLDYKINAETIKVMAWHKMKPMANVVEMTNTYVDESMIATAFMQADDATMYQYGEEYQVDVAPVMYDGVLYAPVRAIAETLGWIVNRVQNDDALTIHLTGPNDNDIVLTENEFEAYVDGSYVSLNNAPMVIDGRMMLPFADIAAYMDYETEQNDEAGTVAVYDSIDWKVKYAIEKYLMPNELRDNKVTDNLTRLELASLIVNMYESITGEVINITRKPFNDCKDEDVLKACSLEIISGKSDNEFHPDSSLTRAEYCKVMHTLLSLLGLDIPYSSENADEFTDIAESHWASRYVYGLKEIGIFDGIYETEFEPERNITIREALAIIGNGYMEMYQTDFPDVSPSNPYRLAIINVCNKGIWAGYDDGTFMPNECVRRSEFTALIARMNGEDIRQSETFSCSDVRQDHWASGCIEYCINKGIMQLENNEFRPDVEITLGETIDALMNYLGFAPTLDIQEKLIQAEKIGLLDNITEELLLDAPCLRGMMAQLIDNTLSIDLNNL